MKPFNYLTRWLVVLTGVIVLVACAMTPHSEPETEVSANASPFDSMMRFYQGPLNHLSAVRRGSCPMYPSCSEYSRQAVARHGFAVGWAMSMDRLMRCGRDELKHAPRVYVDGQWLFYDPVDANDYWWDSHEHDPTALRASP
jgi:putative component of membrane protein insertase Oxa1/YidC/SpoIIIJ protein YidD